MTAQLKEYSVPYRNVPYGTVRLVTSRSVWYNTVQYRTGTVAVPYSTVLYRKTSYGSVPEPNRTVLSFVMFNSINK